MRLSRLAARRVRALLAVAVIIVAGAHAFPVSATAQEDPLPPITGSTIDRVEDYLEMRLSEVGRPGLAAAIVHDGDIISTVQIGEASPGVPMTSDTPMFIASVIDHCHGVDATG